VNVVLHYHTFDGTQGKLSLAPPPEDGIELSQLLKADVEMNGLIICPKGCQRGSDENSESEQIRELFSYEPLMSPDYQICDYFFSKNDTDEITNDEYLHYLCSENASLLFSLTPERQTLNKAIKEKGILSHIQNLLINAKDAKEPRRYLLFDLCAGLPHASCEQALIQLGMSEIAVASDEMSVQTSLHEQIAGDILDAVVGALAIRHVLQPSETLADFLLRLPHTRPLGSATDAAFAALIVCRKGKWLQALTTLHNVDPRNVLQALLLIKEDLTNEECHIADKFVQEQSEPFPKLVVYAEKRVVHYKRVSFLW